MPRTLESITDCHRAATERRKAGRPIWDHYLNIGHLIRELQDNPEADLQETGKQIGALIRASSWAKADVKAIEERGGIASEVMGCAEEFEEVTDEEDFDLILDRLYDLADADRTWIK